MAAKDALVAQHMDQICDLHAAYRRAVLVPSTKNDTLRPPAAPYLMRKAISRTNCGYSSLPLATSGRARRYQN